MFDYFSDFRPFGRLLSNVDLMSLEKILLHQRISWDLFLKYPVWSKTSSAQQPLHKHRWAGNIFALLDTSGWMEWRVPFQEHVGQLSLSLLCHWEKTTRKLHSCYCYSNYFSGKKKSVSMHTYTPTVQVLALIASMRQSGGRVRAAMCEIEALTSPKDAAKAWGEMAQ